MADVGRQSGAGFAAERVGRTIAAGDIDNDGDLDLSVMSYEGPVGKQTPLNALFRNDGANGFVNLLTKDSPLNAGDHGTQLVDYDNDGGLDLTITDGYGDTGGHFVFRNTLPDDVKRRSLSVLVLDAKGHQTRVGAEVRLLDASGRIVATRQVVTGGGYNTQRAAPVHFGLTALTPLTVEVTFMTKRGRVKQTVKDVSPAAYRGKSLIVREGA
jgi:ASPIC/UnbV protein